MKKKSLQLFATLALLGAAGVTQPASATDYKIPATQDEFNSQWEVVAGTDAAKTWTWQEGTPPYAKIAPANNTEAGTDIGSTLILKTPIHFVAGEKYTITAKVATTGTNDDERFYIVYGTDKDNLTAITPDKQAFYIWGTTFNYRPNDYNLSKCTVTIDADGDYYVGIRSWFGTSGASDCLKFSELKLEKDVNYPQKVTNPQAVAADGGALEATLTWTWPTKNKDNSDISGSLGARIYRFTSSSKDQLYKDENVIATVNGGVAGQPGTFIDNATNSSQAIPKAGKYYYYIAPFNDEGENSEVSSSAVAECKWIGEDVKPLNPTNVVAKASGDNVILTWKARKSGEWGYNDGWIDESKLKYKITRSKDGADAVVLTETYWADADTDLKVTYTDTQLDGLASYVYSIYTVYNGVDSNEGKANGIIAGGAMDLPYEDDFSSADKFKLYTVSSGYYTWKRVSYPDTYVQFAGSTGTTDASLITPPIKLEAGKTYKISCKSWVDETEEDDGGDDYPEYPGYGDDYYSARYSYGYGGSTVPDAKDLIFMAGSTLVPDEMTALATVNINKGSSEKMSPEAYFSPSADGYYYFDLRCFNTNSNKIYIDDLKIAESVSAPATVADLSVVPDATGANKAKVTFTLPDKTNGGAELTTLTKVVVSRTDTEAETPAPVVVKTLTGDKATPGTAVSFDDNVDAPGMFSYSVVSTLNDKDSEAAASTPLWVGYDVPKAVSALNISTEAQADGTVLITHNALSGTQLGVHNGYVDADNLKYRVYRTPSIAGGEPQLAGESTLPAEATKLQFTDTEVSNLPWDSYKYSIAVVNGTMEGARAEGNRGVSTGKVSDWPYSPDFSDSKLVESFDGRAFIHENGLTFKNRGAQGSTEYIAYLPPFDVAATDSKGFAAEMQLSRANAEFLEKLEVLLCTLESAAPAQPESKASAKAAVIPGEDNRTSLKTISIEATSDSPATEKVSFTVPAAGRYRLALRCASDDNKGLTIHSLTMKSGEKTGVTEIGADSIFSADVVSVSVYTLDGTLVASCESGADLNLSALRPGVYILRALTADGKTLTAKIRR